MFGQLSAQQYNNLRQKKIFILSDTTKIDSLSIVPGSLVLKDSLGNLLDTNSYQIDLVKGLLIAKKSNFITSVYVNYRVFPVLFTKKYAHKEKTLIEPDHSGNYNPYNYVYKNPNNDIFRTDGLNKTGSISRGLSFGNSQDVIVNSNLNLQLNGKLSEDIDVLAAITDNNIPIQPDGNTQQIQDFDKVFIQLTNKKNKLIAGDFELQRPKSYFMNLYKKAQGGIFSTSLDLSTKADKPQKMNIVLAGAISKGKYTKNTIASIEGNQGPYKLRGANNELYIIVLAGTEKVYIDGQLQKRGQEYDYIIDYNTAELTFMPKNIVTKDKRITVEFEYSDKNYSRSMFFVGDEYETKKLKVKLNVFSEQDSKNQPIQQDLTIEQKQFLAAIGDSLDMAFVPNVDSVAFTNKEVLYKRIDTLVAAVLYDSVYVYSNNADSAHYRLGFSLVGQGKGDYVQIKSSANGKVFQWMAPIAGIRQGNYMPYVLLVTPKKKQMVTLSAEYQITKKTIAAVEIAMTNNDLNTFSTKNKEDNLGYAGKFRLENAFQINKNDSNKWILTSGIQHEWVNKLFNPIERYRDVEFERNWNLTNVNINEDENISGLNFNLANSKTGILNYQAKSFYKGNKYNALQNVLNGDLKKFGFQLTFAGSYLSSKSLVNNTEYYKQKVALSKKIKFLIIGAKEEQERNYIKDVNKDSLQTSSFAFDEYEAFVSSADTVLNKYSLNYKKRFDYSPSKHGFNLATVGETFGLNIGLLKNPKNTVVFTGSYRNLAINDTNLVLLKPDQSVAGRIEYNVKLFKTSVSLNTFYELNSGMEVKKEFSYIEVAQGQGIYAWTDYNSNDIKELSEFEIAAFQDQANYIKVYTPTNEYVKTYSNLFSEVLNINPAIVWANEKGLKKIISKFSAISTYRIDRKTSNSDFKDVYNPFETLVSDSTLISLNSSFRNTLYFNRTNSKFGMEINYQENGNKMLTTNGFDSRTQLIYGGKIRVNFSKSFSANVSYNQGEKTTHSEYLTNRDYRLLYQEVEPIIAIQPNNSFKLSFNYKYSDKKNTISAIQEKANNQRFGTEIKYNVLKKGSLLLKINYIEIKYNGSSNTPLAYEMLEGLKIGSNATWNLSYQRNISGNLQLNLMYDGRKSKDVKTVHVASIQLRAYF